MATKDRANVMLTANPGITPEQARDCRARALRCALDRYFEKQKAADVASTDGDDGTTIEGDSANAPSIPNRPQ